MFEIEFSDDEVVLDEPPPVAPIVFGKLSPVVFPWEESATYFPPHRMPAARSKLVFASTIRASMRTCGVGASRDWTSARISSSLLWMSRTTTMFVRLSTETEPRGLASNWICGTRSWAFA